MGKKCLKCSYERTQNDVAPEYECPKCGAIYEKVEALNRRKKAPTKNEKRYTSNTEANEQVNVIAELVNCGKSNDDIANHLQNEKYRNLRTNENSWNSGDVDQIRKSFNLFVNKEPKPKNSTIDESKKNTIIKTYEGSKDRAIEKFQEDSEKMSAQGYYPASQTWAPGTWGCGSFLIALILFLVLIGILVFIYMLIVKPAGTLTVVYEHKELPKEISNIPSALDMEKECPMCAETVKFAAKVCRYCGYKFEKATS